MYYTSLGHFKTKLKLLTWLQLILRRLLTYHTTSEKSPLSRQRAEHQISSQTMGHKMWDLWRRINCVVTDRVQFECESGKWKKKETGRMLKEECTKVKCQSSRRQWLMETQTGLDIDLRLRRTFEVRCFFNHVRNSAHSFRLHAGLHMHKHKHIHTSYVGILQY